MVVVEAVVLEGFFREGQTLSDLFYMNNRLMASQMPAMIQAAHDVLTGLSDCVGIQKNIVNMVGMTCLPCLTSRSLSEVFYMQRMTGSTHRHW